ncbi:hypothetical protein IF1G_00605 [Cordyceps javanica]|uniref:Uncharacterized protein n=1 Tax=Cordyceps javanica TaxID=43265 RepID=A0A545WCZ4_9HYPO|nr:hypothetical protein IF1G_00605 [Cordyceps javanica]TQW11854.1 hypothetical protein IF2G_00585 [Cordyceps javanica]
MGTDNVHSSALTAQFAKRFRNDIKPWRPCQYRFPTPRQHRLLLQSLSYRPRGGGGGMKGNGQRKQVRMPVFESRSIKRPNRLYTRCPSHRLQTDRQVRLSRRRRPCPDAASQCLSLPGKACCRQVSESIETDRGGKRTRRARGPFRDSFLRGIRGGH